MGRKRNLPEALHHVLFEIEMLVNSIVVLSKGNLSQIENTVWVEVFALHLRNLDEFFGRRKTNSNYMKPEHFVAWSSEYSSDPKIIRRASHEISHLTYDRKAPGKKIPWDVGKYFAPIRQECIRFLESTSTHDDLLSFQDNRERQARLLDLLKRLKAQNS